MILHRAIHNYLLGTVDSYMGYNPAKPVVHQTHINHFESQCIQIYRHSKCFQILCMTFIIRFKGNKKRKKKKRRANDKREWIAANVLPNENFFYKFSLDPCSRDSGERKSRSEMTKLSSHQYLPGGNGESTGIY